MTTIKGNKVLNLPVITMNNGKQVAKIQDIIYDPRTNQVKAFLISEGGWFKEAEVLLIQDVKSIGADAVMIDGDTFIRPANEVDNAVSSIAESENYLTKNQVITQQGTKLGKVVDIYFEFPGGRVTDLEVSEGFIKNLSSGTKTIPVANIVTVGEEALIVSGYVENHFEQQAERQGLQGALNSAKETVTGAWSATKDKAVELGSAAKEKSGEFAQNIQTKAQEVATSEPFTNAKETVVTKFQEVRDHVQAGKAEEQAKSMASDLLSKAQSGYQTVKTAVVTTTTDVATTAAVKTDEARVHGALGKKLGSVTLLTRDDQIIAEPGDTITNEIIAKSQAHGVIDKLINNVV